MNDERARNEDGQYVETVTVDDVFAAVRDGGHVVTTPEVASAVGCSTEAARVRLHKLHDAGRIERKKVSANAQVWWLAQDSDTR